MYWNSYQKECHIRMVKQFKVISEGELIKIGGFKGCRCYIIEDEKGIKYSQYARNPKQALKSIQDRPAIVLKGYIIKEG